MTGDLETDVVVVGYGAAGAATAIAARDAGADVIVLEKQAADADGEIRHTSNTRYSAGIVLAPTDAGAAFTYQKALNDTYGVDDVPETMLRVWAREIVENEAWLRGLDGGDAFYVAAETGPESLGGAQWPELPGAESTRRLQNARGGNGLFEILDRNAVARGATVLYESPARDLVQDPPTGAILGVRVDGGTVWARRAVVLTCGGFEFNDAMKATYLRVWPCRFYGHPGNTGDGVRMALKVGADLWHMTNISGMATAGWPDSPHSFLCTPWWRGAYCATEFRDGTPIPATVASYSAIIVDRHGQRFAQEIYKQYAFYWSLVRFDTDRAEFPRIPAHLVFDEKTRREGPVANMSGPFGPLKLYEWSSDNNVEIERGWIHRADTVRQLAGLIGVPPDGLEQTVSRWNDYCRDGNDPECERAPETLSPLDTPPYYAIVQWPGSGNTLGGPRRDEHARVLDPDGQPIPRLYSAGELGSIYGFLYQGGGNLAECLAFGRIAGANATAETPVEAGVAVPAGF